MTSVDLAAITAAQGVSVPLFGGRLPTATGSSDPLSGFDTAGSLYVILHAVPRSKQPGVTPSLVVTVEHSDDGVSWSTAATSTTFDGSDDGMDLLTIDTPKSFVRLSWVASGSAWLLSATAKPGLAAAAPSGGSTPDIYANIAIIANDGDDSGTDTQWNLSKWGVGAGPLNTGVCPSLTLSPGDFPVFQLVLTFADLEQSLSLPVAQICVSNAGGTEKLVVGCVPITAVSSNFTLLKADPGNIIEQTGTDLSIDGSGFVVSAAGGQFDVRVLITGIWT